MKTLNPKVESGSPPPVQRGVSGPNSEADRQAVDGRQLDDVGWSTAGRVTSRRHAETTLAAPEGEALITIGRDRAGLLVDQRVVVAAEKHEVVEIGRPASAVPPHVMGVDEACLRATGELTPHHAGTEAQRPPLVPARRAHFGAQPQGNTVVVDQQLELGVAQDGVELFVGQHLAGRRDEGVAAEADRLHGIEVEAQDLGERHQVDRHLHAELLVARSPHAGRVRRVEHDLGHATRDLTRVEATSLLGVGRVDVLLACGANRLPRLPEQRARRGVGCDVEAVAPETKALFRFFQSP